MFDHIQLKVKDLKASKRFYTAALAPLGFTMEYEGDGLIGFGLKGAPALWLGEGESRGPVHIAFTAKDRAAVRAFYAASLPAGGTRVGNTEAFAGLPVAMLRPLVARRWNRAFQGAVDGLIRRAANGGHASQ